MPALNRRTFVAASAAALVAPTMKVRAATAMVSVIDGGLPATAIIEFDVADAAIFNTMPSGTEGTLWDDIVTHEMMHTVGFGTIWTYLDLLSGGGTATPTFTGENATAVYEAAAGVTSSGGVPVEGDGGPGTRDSH